MNDLKKEIDELIDIIKDTDIYKKYLHIENQIESNEDINHLVSEIKKLQQEAVKEEQKNHSKEVKELDKIIDTKIKELNDIPLYADYLEASEDVNNLVQDVKNQIQSYIDDLDV